MSERPILFSDAMVRAILDGRKTQTRRVVKYHPSDGAFYLLDGWPHRSTDGESNRLHGMEEPYGSPYGQPGDTLWVREAHYLFPSRHVIWTGTPRTVHPTDDWQCYYREGFDRVAPHWRPSIHMPRWASRLSLRVTEVRVERLQAISEEDARREGCGLVMVDSMPTGLRQWGTERVASQDRRGLFAWLWDSINGERPGCSWQDNPWVWVVGFEREEVPRG